jgi:hypothetical protein
MAGMEPRIRETLSKPEPVLASLSDERARLYYRFYVGTGVGNKHLCVVVRVQDTEAFILTAYLTDRVKKGRVPWPREK